MNEGEALMKIEELEQRVKNLEDIVVALNKALLYGLDNYYDDIDYKTRNLINDIEARKSFSNIKNKLD